MCGVSENALFPVEVLQSGKNLTEDDRRNLLEYASQKTWEGITREHYEEAEIVIDGISAFPAFKHLPSFLFLAQHPRVPLASFRYQLYRASPTLSQFSSTY
jgi:hypothetical protein